MTAIINGCTCMGTPEEILRLMQLAGKAEFTYSFTSSLDEKKPAQGEGKEG